MFAVTAPNNKPVVGAQLCGIFVHLACAHLNLHSSPLLPPLTIWAARELGSNLVCSGRDYCASIASLPLGDQRGSDELYEKTNTDAFARVPSGHPTPTPSSILYADCSEAARVDCSLSPVLPDFLFPSALRDILSGLLMSHFLYRVVSPGSPLCCQEMGEELWGDRCDL